MGQVIALELGAAVRAPDDTKGQGATVCILPVVRIERAAEFGLGDAWQGMPSDSAPAYAVPDHDDA